MTSRVIASRLRTPPRRYATTQRTSPGGTVTDVTRLLSPNENELNSNLEEAVLNLRDDVRPENTAKSQDPKVLEYFQYCDVIYEWDPYRCILSCAKVYRFMWYTCFREQRPKGATKAQRLARQQGHYFNEAEYREVMRAFENGPADLLSLPQPKKPIGKCTFDSYKAVLHKIYKVQIAKKVLTGTTWDQIWQICFDELYKHVKERIPLLKKASYAEKVDGEFAPYMIVEHYGPIEELMWHDSNAKGNRSICCALRHRYCVLHLTSGILRCESLYRAEFSDYLGIHVPKQDTDVHRPYLMVNQIAIGKTTHGRKQYGRATRHRDPRLCCIGAFAMYVQFRFHCTGEFTRLSLEDWMDNKKWFDIKVLADVCSTDTSKVMKNDSYEAHIKTVLRRLNLNLNKVLHLGRNLGSKYLELLEAESSEIRKMGQWADGVQDTSYSAKLPMGPIRKLAGFFGHTKMYFNTRTDVQPPKELLLQTPIGKWVYDIYDEITEVAEPGKHMTAICMLRFFIEINKIFMQDAAAIIALYPERADHALFKEMPCFVSDEFEVRSETTSDQKERCLAKVASLSSKLFLYLVIQSNDEESITR
jgi:Centromere DNA-binding protein complex CBF3 subunit, domain 2